MSLSLPPHFLTHMQKQLSQAAPTTRSRGRPLGSLGVAVDPAALLQQEFVATVEEARKLRKALAEQRRHILTELGPTTTLQKRMEALEQLADVYAKLTKASEGMARSLAAIRRESASDSEEVGGLSLEDLAKEG